MASAKDDNYLFVVEWFDPMPQLKRKYLLKYFIDQHMVEMIGTTLKITTTSQQKHCNDLRVLTTDLKSKKMFLKKSPCPPEVSGTDFVVGGKGL